MPTKGTYGFYEKLQPLQPTTVIDKAAERENKRRALDIAEADRKAKEAEQNRTDYKYQKEDWSKAIGNWNDLGAKITTNYEDLAVQINESDMPKHLKKRYISQLESNPDGIVRIFNEFDEFAKKLTNPEFMDKLDSTKADDFALKVASFMNGNFDVRFNDDYTMDIVEIDKEGNEKVVSIKQYYDEVQGMKDDFNKAIAQTGKWAKITSLTKLDNPERMWDYNKYNPKTGQKGAPKDLGSKNDENSLYNVYYNAFRKEYGSGMSETEIDKQINEMYQRDVKLSKPLVTDNGGNEPDDYNKYEWRLDKVDPKIDKGGNASGGVIYDKGTKSNPFMMFADKDTGASIAGKPTNVKYDANGNLVELTILAVSVEDLNKVLDSGGIDGVTLNDIETQVLLSGAKKKTYTPDNLSPEAIQLINTELAKLRGTLTDYAKKNKQQIPPTPQTSTGKSAYDNLKYN